MQFGICYGLDSGRASHCGLSWLNLLQVPSQGRDAVHPRKETNSPLLVIRTSRSLKFQLLQEIPVGHRIAPRPAHHSEEPSTCVESSLFSRPIPRSLPAYSKRPQRVSAIVVRMVSAIGSLRTPGSVSGTHA